MNYGYIYDTCIGKLRIVQNDKGICEVSFKSEGDPVTWEETPLLKKAYQQLQEYFEGNRKNFDLPIDMGGTQFQQKTWQALLKIPYGETWTYKQVAIAAGNEKASRAVGNANNKNHIAIIIPCHRVIGSNGNLVGYAGGLDKKEYLLELEQKYK